MIAATDATSTAPALACRNCGEPLRRLALRGHYGRPVEIDDCRTCHLLWFDSLEASRLSGTGMIGLIRAMAAGHAAPHRPLRQDLGCARCGGTVRPVLNRSRFGQAQQLECPRGHGAWHTYGGWLAERGFVRPMASTDVTAFAREGLVRHCFNCGAPAGDGGPGVCAWCGAAAALMDVDRLVRSVDPEGATRPPVAPVAPTTPEPRPRVRPPAATAVESACHACGDGEAGPGRLRCGRCGATRTAGDLGSALRALEAIEPALTRHEQTPADHVRARRLAALQGDMPRRRETVQWLEREAGGAGRRGPADGLGAGWPLPDAGGGGMGAFLGLVVRLLRSLWGGRL